MSSRARIVPEATELTEPFWTAARDGGIALQWCTDCRRVWHPPEPVCPHCASHLVEWVRASGGGRLYSYTQVHHAAHPAVADTLPYLVALVELDEGPRLICNLVDCAAEDIQPSLRVRIGKGPAAGGGSLLVARPAPSDPSAAPA